MQMPNYIQQLLHQHDCVIVPQWGGFVCAHKKLEFNVQAGFINPPQKTVAFNQNLNNNDGLLANYIVQKEKIGYTKALENINAWVSQLHHQLQQGQTVVLEGLGSFSLNDEKRVVFAPLANANFSTASYGLGQVSLGKKIAAAPAAKTEAQPAAPLPVEEHPPLTAKKTKKPVPPPAPTIPPTRTAKKQNKVFRRVVAVVFTLLLFFAFFILQDYAYHAKMDKGSLMNFEQSNIPTIPHPPLPADEPIPSSQATENATNTKASEKNAQKSLENTTNTQPRVETSTVQSTKTDSVFYIIAGAFSSESNANDLLNTLNQKGFAPEIIKVQGSSLYRVGYKRFATRKEAESKLNSVRNQTHNFAAWVFAAKP